MAPLKKCISEERLIFHVVKGSMVSSDDPLYSLGIIQLLLALHVLKYFKPGWKAKQFCIPLFLKWILPEK